MENPQQIADFRRTLPANDDVMETKMTVKYEIRKGDTAPCKLVSIVQTKFGGDAVNFVADGTHTYCKDVKDRLERVRDMMGGVVRK